MLKPLLATTILAVTIACSDDPMQLPADTGAAVDSGSQDSGARDIGVSDLGISDSGAFDSGTFDSGVDSGTPDLGFVDAGEEDASVPDSGPLACNGVGAPCGNGDPCPNGLFCGQGDFCRPAPECGGFVMAVCAAPRAICMYYQGADYGPCFTPLEKACVCTNPVTAVYFPDC